MNVNEWLGENNQLGIDIWTKKYQYNNETFDEWLDRVSGGDADVRELIKEKKFLFAGRILSNRGLYKDGHKITYSNCYVISPPEDSIESIFDCAKRLARTFSYGGGCGIDISKLSPKGATVNNAAKETSGSVSFMDLYSLTTELIGQNGRRGALMISIACDHPDIEDFITIKSDLDKVTKANISIRVTDDFMNAVIHNKDFELKFTREETGEVIKKVVKANEIFGKFCEMNWDYAEPAFLFWDRIEKYNLLEYVGDFEYAGVNPCAEEPLPAGGSCLLGSLNLAEFVKDGVFDYIDFEKAVRIAVDGLNDVLDEGLPLHPLKEQRDSVRDWRQIGLGIMGLADMLIKLGIEYGSEESIDICDSIGYALATTAIHESANLAHKYGSFPKFTEDVYKSKFYDSHKLPSRPLTLRPLRNSQLLTIAPTGTLSTMLGISGGIEPIFANSYTRKTESLHGEDVEYKVYTPIVEKYMKEHNITNEENLPPFFVTSANIPHRNRIDMQAIWQRHIDASISSTVNLPNSATVEDIKDLYIYAWKKGLKGITVFRDGCKRAGILTTNNNTNETTPNNLKPNDLPRGYVLDAADEGIGLSTVIHTGCGKVYLYVKFDPDNGEPYEIFVNKGSNGTCRCNIEGIARMTSYALRSGVCIEGVIDQLQSVDACAAYAAKRAKGGTVSKGTCCPSAIGYALERLNKQYKEMFVDCEEDVSKVDVAPLPTIIIDDDMICPECGEPLYHEGGCDVCRSCGYSHCG